MSTKIKVKSLKPDVIVPIELSSAFYYHMHSASISMLADQPDARKALENIDQWGKDPSFKLTAVEHGIMVLMNLIHELETVALTDPAKYIQEYEKEIDPNTEFGN